MMAMDNGAKQMARMFVWGDPVRHRKTGKLYKVLSNRQHSFEDEDYISVGRLIGNGPGVRGRSVTVKAKYIEDAAIENYSRNAS